MADLIYLDKERTRLRGDKPMTGAEKLDELQWLLDAGVHPAHAAAQLGAKVGSLETLANRHGRAELSATLKAAALRADAVPPHWRAA